ncbi:hypothetical protein [Enterovibrio sp. 27052020O]|uniref:hypothetical protein n=1 Tax=Enterovibrio sp. 27052020O TaxID=3241166 RepID=UPI00389019C1
MQPLSITLPMMAGSEVTTMMKKPHPIKTPIKEFMAIKAAMAMLTKSGHFTVNTKTQFGRVIKMTVGPAWKTLRQIEADIAFFFPCDPDTQAAISARLREVAPSNSGLVKQRRHYTSDNGKVVYVYRLVPSAWLAMRNIKEAA